MNCFGHRKRPDKQQRRQEKERQRDRLRQTDPDGLLKIALKPGPRRQSFTAADPEKFYREKGQWERNAAEETSGTGGCCEPGGTGVR
ncbi:hypothetical protein LTR37_019409 [Vermiconidia calcicola]|uniref:Uncharacterized protein n=1 Tax=Vermiconidia calcicola TaxID=1690605 RepID=A0ACC3ME61_9PEZI|nr:hypothetical protein LTR37_019409 [Vermiconidia calcicola]